MLRNRADINFTNEHGNTPLHYACFWGYQQIAEDLIAHGAIVSLANKDGDTPLDKARGSLAKRFHGELIEYLFNYCVILISRNVSNKYNVSIFFSQN